MPLEEPKDKARKVPDLMLCFSNPFNFEPIVTSLSPFRRHSATKEARIHILAIDDPKISCIGEDIQPAPAVVEHSAHPLPPTVIFPVIQTHLAPQNVSTFRT